MNLTPAPSPADERRLADLYTGGHHDALEHHARTLLQSHPGWGPGWKMLGVSLLARGKEALPALQKAADLLPGDADAHNNLGVALQAAGNDTAAMRCFEQALVLRPAFASALSNLGNLQLAKGNAAEAAASYQRALAITPNVASLLSNLGTAQQGLGQHDQALASLQRALAINPGDVVARNNLAALYLAMGQAADALESYRQVCVIQPDSDTAHQNAGNVHLQLGQFKDAAACFERALQINPNNDVALSNLGTVHFHLGQPADAATCYQTLLVINPVNAEAHRCLAFAKLQMGLLDDALAAYQTVLQLSPDDPLALSDTLFCHAHSPQCDAATLFAEHRRFGQQFEAPLRPHWPQHSNPREPNRPLQVGLVSPDLREHVVALFLEPLLAALAERADLVLHAYHCHKLEDAVSLRLKPLFGHWRAVADLTNSDLARQITDDGIDILIDLSGHTGQNRLMAFARKPAPLQMSWLGYPGTTGLAAIDYYLADPFVLPPGQLDAQFTEKIVRLPALAPFMPDRQAPPVSALPALTNGFITFGSFNRPIKLNRPLIACWAALLRALPSARLLLGSVPPDGPWRDWLAQEGVAPERVACPGRVDAAAYRALHQGVDICLDTFPYNGATTSWSAIWLGVPTLTLAGSTPAGCYGAAIMTQLGLPDFVAHDAADFVQRGVYWATHLSELAAVRASLRERFASCPAGQPDLIAAALALALRRMWQRWCAGLPATAFAIAGLDPAYGM
jgi:predicted O-linked N-acetylglucosamine transferase (SPINDLY family)